MVKRLLISFGLVLALAIPSFSSVTTPKDNRGHSLPTLDWVGADVCTVDNADGAADVTCATGAGMVYGVIVSSVAATDYLVIKDSVTVTGGSEMSRVYAKANGQAVTDACLVVEFPVPLKFDAGLIVAASGAPAVSTGLWTVIYRARTATE